MLAADTHLDARTRCPTALGSDADQVADAVLVEADKGIGLEDALVHIGLQEPAGVVAADAEGGLGQVVGAEAEELGVFGQVGGAQCGAGQFDHGADKVFDPVAGLGKDGLGGAVGQFAQIFHLQPEGDQRVHDLGDGGLGRGLFHLQRRLEDGADLHLIDFRIGDAQPATPVAEHGIGLVQFLRPALQLGGVEALRDRQRIDLGVGVGDELVQRRVEQAHGDRQAGHDGEQFNEIGLLERRDLRQRQTAAGLVIGQDHLAHGGDAGVVEEHVLGPAQADTLGPEATSRLRIQRRLGIGAHLQASDLVGPGHQGLEITGQLRLDHGHGPVKHLALRAVDGDDVAGPEGTATGGEGPGPVVDRQLIDAADAGPPHAARHHSGMAGHAAPRRDDAAGRMHAVDVFRRSLLAHQDDGVAQL